MHDQQKVPTSSPSTETDAAVWHTAKTRGVKVQEGCLERAKWKGTMVRLTIVIHHSKLATNVAKTEPNVLLGYPNSPAKPIVIPQPCKNAAIRHVIAKSQSYPPNTNPTLEI